MARNSKKIVVHRWAGLFKAIPLTFNVHETVISFTYFERQGDKIILDQ